ncbi:uncharacterized protein L201_006656 [Kwoniella dendrophila CBS 6074]|uniref:Uncharacterized protein n=1 Tax=Kwoniella dendrophila CBS 6074 TaxID=1295534 RepID=A0AAX4K4L7_9TREE
MSSNSLTTIIPNTASFVTHKALAVIYIFYVGLPLKIMSAVVDSIAEAVTPSTPLSPSRSKENDVSSQPRQTTSNGDLKSDDPSPDNTLVNTTSSSEWTRVGTPPANRSASSGNRRVSISAASPLITTYHSGSNRHLYQYEEEEFQLSGSENEDEPLIIPHHSINFDNTFESNATSGTDANASANSTSAPDISLGSQSIPFPLRQRGIQADAHSTPSRPSAQSFAPKYRNTATPPVVIRPTNTVQGIRPATSTFTTMTATSVISGGDDYEYNLLSSWRREQLKTTRTAKLMAGTTPRPIPTLHGPLSLPYARNPSGVDATVADESAYLSHVFGLRAAGGMTISDSGFNAARKISAGTQSSGTTNSRSTSGSSGFGNTTRSSQNKSGVTEGSSYSSIGGTHYTRPVVIRDPYQNIGIKIKGVPPKEGPTVPIKKDVINENKENIDPASSGILRRRASETSLLEPKLGEAVIGPSRSQVNLREMTTLSPIPGSPAENAFRDPFRVLYDRAISSSEHDNSVGQANQAEDPASTQPVIRSASATGPIQLPTLVPIYFNPSTMAYEVAVPPPGRSAYEDLHINTPQGAVTPQTLKNAQAASNQPSKADTSENWRKKGSDESADQVEKPELATSPPQNSLSADKGAEGEVMTIDSLFEKFHPEEQQIVQGSEPVAAAKTDSKTESGKQSGLRSSKGNPLSPRGTAVDVLGEITGKLNVNATPCSPSKPDKGSAPNRTKTSSPITTKSMPTPSRANSSSARGTPGAGKLLKRGKEGDDETIAATAPAQTKGKGKRRGKSSATAI